MIINKQLELFKSNLPKKPYCTNELENGLLIRNASTAIKKRYIQPNNTNSKLWLMYDIDRDTSVDQLTDDLNLPTPTFFVQNKKNGHAHALYALETPIHFNEHSSSKAIRFAAAVDIALSVKMQADANYVGLITKNPVHESWQTYAFDARYDLTELSDYVDLQTYADRRKKLPAIGLGRNCALFDSVRIWAYKAVRDYRNKSSEIFIEAVLTKASNYNTITINPLPFCEVKSIAKSIAKFCLLNDKEMHKKFIARQSYKGKKSGEARLLTSEQKRATARLMKAKDASYNEIAKELNVARRTVIRWCSESNYGVVT